jgi:L-iditol 2-dehydrogenase
LLLLAAAQLRGARVILAGRHAQRLAVARRWGAAIVLDAAETGEGASQVAALRAVTEGGRGADIVFEAIGRPETWQVAVACARPGGTVDLFGGCPGGSTVTFDTFPLHYEERTLKGTFHHTPRHFGAAVEAIVTGVVHTADLISGGVALDDLVPTFERLERGEGLKYAIRPAPRASA